MLLLMLLRRRVVNYGIIRYFVRFYIVYDQRISEI